MQETTTTTIRPLKEIPSSFRVIKTSLKDDDKTKTRHCVEKQVPIEQIDPIDVRDALASFTPTELIALGAVRRTSRLGDIDRLIADRALFVTKVSEAAMERAVESLPDDLKEPFRRGLI